MGLSQNSGGNAKFLRVKDGKFYISKEDTPYDELEGVIMDVYLKNEEYEGKPLQKLYVVLQDEGEKYILNINFESSYATSLIGFLKNVNLNKPVTLVPIMRKEKNSSGVEVENRRILVKQSGNFVKAFYTKDNPNGLPAMKKIERRGGKVEWDKGDMMDFYASVVEDELKPAVNTNKPKTVFQHQETSPTKSAYVTPIDTEELDVSDDLPF